MRRARGRHAVNLHEHNRTRGLIAVLLLGSIVSFGVLIEHQTRRAVVREVTITPSCDGVDQQAALEFARHLYFGVAFYRFDPIGDGIPFEFYGANRAAMVMLPRLATAHRGQRPAELWPEMLNDQGAQYWALLQRAHRADVAVTAGVTVTAGHVWYSAIVPVQPDLVAVVFHPLDDDDRASFAFSREEQISAQYRYLEELLDRAGAADDLLPEDWTDE